MKILRNFLIVTLFGVFTSTALAETIINANQVGNLAENNRPNRAYLTGLFGNGAKNIGLLQFDLTAFANVPTSSATLNLYHQANFGYGAIFNLYINTSPWDASINSWADIPTHLANPTAQLIINDLGIYTWRTVDVTEAFNAWISGSLPNYGFTLEREDRANPVVFFAAGVNETNGYGPTLSIAAVPEPETYAMFLAGVGLIGFIAMRRSRKSA